MSLVVLLGAMLASPSSAAIITVTSTADGGPGTLRAAIDLANLSPGPDVVVFSTGAATITLDSNLPLLLGNRTEIHGDTGPITLQKGTYADPSWGIAVVDADSCVVRGLTVSGFERGILISSLQETATYNRIGGAGPQGNALTGNAEGVRLEGSEVRFNTVLGNTIDQSLDTGIFLTAGCTDNQIGPDNRVIRSGADGIRLASDVLGVLETAILGNFVGTDQAGTAGLGNGRHGIVIESQSCTNNTVASNLVIENGEFGILLAGSAVNQVTGNEVGIAAGTSRGNRVGIGVNLGAQQNTIGPGNLVSGNVEFGIAVQDTGTTLNEVIGNIVGLDSGGNAPVPNGLSGIIVDWAPNLIEGNRVAGNGNHGIEIVGPFDTNYVTVRLNRVGTNAAGSAAVPNTNDGISVLGAALGTRIIDNLISGNGRAGVMLTSGCIGSFIRMNKIGVDITGTMALPNDVGLDIQGGGNAIGGELTLLEGNVISHNTRDGMRLAGVASSDGDGNLIMGNTIEANGENGIWFQDGALNNTVGDSDGTRNTIRGNGGHGVRVASELCLDCPRGNVIRYNSITANAGDAIDLFSSTPPGNNGILAPTIFLANAHGAWGNTNLGGLETTVQVFTDSEDETETFIGEVLVPSGSSLWHYSGSLAVGMHLTATNTAEFPDTTTNLMHTSEPSDPFTIDGGPEIVIFNGILNQALGGATIDLQGGSAAVGHLPGADASGPEVQSASSMQGGTIRVGNLGPSGADGISLMLESSGSMVRFAPLPDPGPGGPPDGTRLEFISRDTIGVLRGRTEPAQDSLRVSLTYRMMPDRVVMLVDLGIFAQVGLQVFGNGTLVASGDASASQIGSANHMLLEFEPRLDYALDPQPGWPADGPTLPVPAFLLEFPAGTEFDLPDLGGTIIGDELRIIADTGSQGFGVTYESTVQIEIVSLSVQGPNALTGFEIMDEALVNFGRCQKGLGRALLNLDTPIPGAVIVSNLGGSGADGVLIPWEDDDLATGFAIAHPDSAGSSPPGWHLEQMARGVLDGVPMQTLASARITRTMAGYELSPDYVPMNPDSIRFEAFDGRIPVGFVQTAAHLGPVVGLSDLPAAGRIMRGGVISYSYDAMDRATMELPGGVIVMADRLRITPVNPQVEPTDWDDAMIVGKDVPDGAIVLLGSPNILDLGSGESAAGLGPAHINRLGVQHSVLAIHGGRGNGALVLDTEPNPALDLAWGPIGPAPLPPGTHIEYRDRLSPPGGGEESLGGSLGVDGELQVRADMAALGATLVTARAFSQGVLVGEVTGLPNGSVATLDAFPVGAGSAVNGAGEVRYWSKLRPGTMVTLETPGPGKGAAVTSVVADLVMVIPEDATTIASAVEGAEIHVAEIPYLLLTEKRRDVPLSVTDRASPVRTLFQPPAPNPFGMRTTMILELARPGLVRVQVYDVTGRRVATLADRELPGGRHSLVWNGLNDAGHVVSSGVYFVRAEAPGIKRTTRVVRLP